MPRPIVALLTDFGAADGYVAAMKGVILGLCPDASLVDITHDIAPQSVLQGAFVLGTASRFFPRGTVFVAVVDPGVGTQRRALALETPQGRWVAPDNGLLTFVVREHLAQAPAGEPFTPVRVTLPPGWRGVALTNAAYWRRPVSATFHGRDIFAPVAAHLAAGAPLEEMGERVSDVTVLAAPEPVRGDRSIWGVILHVDRFGNLVTNVPGGMLPGGNLQVRVGGATIEGLSATYGEGRGLVALVGSHGSLEIALPGGSAAGVLGVGVGGGVEVVG